MGKHPAKPALDRNWLVDKRDVACTYQPTAAKRAEIEEDILMLGRNYFKEKENLISYVLEKLHGDRHNRER